MTTTSHRRIAASGSVALLTFAVFVLLVSIAQAAGPSTPLRGGAGPGYLAAATPLRGGAGPGYAAAGPAGNTIYAGRGGVFGRPTPVAASPATIIGGFAVSAFLIALVAFVALGSRARRRGELAPVTSLAEAPTRNPAMGFEDRERKAA
jgi:hypothetical protein